MTAPTLRGERVELRPLAVADLDALHAIVLLPGVERWWNPHTRTELDVWLTEAAVLRRVVWVDGEPIGMVQAHEKSDDFTRDEWVDGLLLDLLREERVG